MSPPILFMILSPFLLLGTLLGMVTPLQAQLIPDGSLGSESSRVIPNSTINNIPSDRIEGGASRGNHLFHSFREFNVNPGRGVFFENPSHIQNIFTRVTGQNPSQILGTLGVLGNANLFLINPNGILFGRGSRLDVKGSFLGSTASSILFNNNLEYSASHPQPLPLLTINTPLGLQFRGGEKSITVAGDLQVGNGQELSLIANGINLQQGILTATDGVINLQGVSQGNVDLRNRLFSPSQSANVILDQANLNVVGLGPGQINIQGKNLQLNQSNLTAGINPNTEGIRENPGTISLEAREGITISNSRIETDVKTNAVGNGGDIKIKANNLWVNNNSVILSGARRSENYTNNREANGGNITIDVQNGVNISGRETKLITNVGNGVTGESGKVRITVTNGGISLSDGAEISTGTSGQGKANQITLIAKNAVILDQKSQINSMVDHGAIAQGGNINILAENLILRNDSQMETGVRGEKDGKLPGRGNSGHVVLNVKNAVLEGSFIKTNTGVSVDGNSGSIDIRSQSLTLTNGSRLVTNTSGKGNAGKINLEVKDIVLEGNNTGILAEIDQESTGQGSKLIIQTDHLTIKDHSRISVETRAITPKITSEEQGRGGQIIIVGNIIELQNGGQITSSTLGTGNTNRLIVGGKRIILSGQNTTISSEVSERAKGNSGKLIVQGERIFLYDGARITTNSVSEVAQDKQDRGKAGQVIIGANSEELGTGISDFSAKNNLENRPVLQLIMRGGSQISSSTKKGSGGDVILRLGSLEMRQNSYINSSAGNSQDTERNTGGNININSKILVGINNSDIASNAYNGLGGRINVDSPLVFGFKSITRKEVESRLTQTEILQPNFSQLLLTNDIIAISQTDASLSGTVVINTSAINPTSGLIQLPENIVDPASLIGQNPCVRGKNSQFIVTGKGGLPPQPGESLNHTETRVDLVQPPSSNSQVNLPQTSPVTSSSRLPITPAMGWIFNEKGEVILVGYDPSGNSPIRPEINPLRCQP